MQNNNPAADIFLTKHKPDGAVTRSGDNKTLVKLNHVDGGLVAHQVANRLERVRATALPEDSRAVLGAGDHAFGVEP